MSEWQETEFGRIPSDWKLIKSNEFCLGIADGTHDSPKRKDEGHYLITSKHIKGRDIDFENAYLISKEDFDKINQRSQVDQWDVIISMIGEYCGFCYIERNEHINYAVKNVGLFKLGDETKAFWLYYYLNSTIGRYFIDVSKSGTSQPYLSLGVLRDFPILVPPTKAEQKAIAAVLSSLDDKIDLLQRQNQTLEALAQTLFRQWFVVEAQDDWEGKPLDEIADYLNGLACQKYPPENDVDKLPVLKIRELRSGVSDLSDYASTEVSPEYIIENGDVIFSWSGSLMVKIWDGDKCVLNQHLFKVSSEQFPKWFYYFWTIHHLEKFIAIAESKATTMGHIKRADLSSSMVLIPTPPELKKMDQIMAPLIDKIILNNRQATKLTLMRDTLLPKLMSGEVRVRL